MKVTNHVLEEAEFFSSPNFSLRPAESDISLIVVHGITMPPGQFGGTHIIDFFLNRLDISAHPFFEEVKDLHVSSHLLIRRDGTILQFVPFNMSAHHAGVSEFMGRSRCNDFSIGIELEGTDEVPYTEIQYTQLNHVIAALRKTYPLIKKEYIVGHCDIAPGRKTDPGPFFEWDKIHRS